jgi:hypothetical protein
MPPPGFYPEEVAPNAAVDIKIKNPFSGHSGESRNPDIVPAKVGNQIL